MYYQQMLLQSPASIRTWLIALLCQFALLSAPSRAEEASRYLFVGTFFPYVLEQSMDGSARGLSVDILDRITALTGDRFEIRILPWARALSMVENGSADGIIGPYKTPTREKFIDFSESEIYRDHMVFLCRAGASDATEKWRGRFSDLQDRKVITVRGWAYGAGFDDARSRLEIIETNSFAQGLQMLLRDRGELLAANERNALYEVRKEQLADRVDFLRPAFQAMVGYFGFSRQKADRVFQDRFNRALNQLHSSGEISELWSEYGLKSYPRNDQPH